MASTAEIPDRRRELKSVSRITRAEAAVQGGRGEGLALGEGRGGAFRRADGRRRRRGRFSHTFSTTGSESVWPMVTLVLVVVWQRRGYLWGVEGF